MSLKTLPAITIFVLTLVLAAGGTLIALSNAEHAKDNTASNTASNTVSYVEGNLDRVAQASKETTERPASFSHILAQTESAPSAPHIFQYTPVDLVGTDSLNAKIARMIAVALQLRPNPLTTQGSGTYSRDYTQDDLERVLDIARRNNENTRTSVSESISDLSSSLTQSGTFSDPTLTNANITTLTVSGTTRFNDPLTLAQTTAPATSTDKLYNLGGDLYWAGNPIVSASVGQWASDGANAWRASGNVGIGTSSPSATLSVRGAGTGSGLLAQFTDSANSPKVTILDNGNVGIGITSPAYTLDVQGNLNIASGSGLRVHSELITDFSGAGLQVNSGMLSVATSSLNINFTDMIGTLAIAQGGTGATSLTGLLQGNGTGAFTALADSSTVGQILRVTGPSTYAWGALDLADTDAISGVLADGYFAKTGNWLGTLGGVASSSFLRSDQSDTASGLITFNDGLLSLATSTFSGRLQAGGSSGLYVLPGGSVGVGSDSTGGARVKVTQASMSITEGYDNSARVASFSGTGIVSGQVVLSNDGTCGSYNVIGANSIVYGTVLGEDGNCWLDRNLGASRVALSGTDASAYGYYYQWGRLTDGHQISTSGTTATLSGTDTPGHGNFILSPASQNDWRSPQNNTLWQGVSGINNVCPSGFRLPTQPEWSAYVAAAGITNSATAYSSSLKLPAAGRRARTSGAMGYVGSGGYYWSSSVSGAKAHYLDFSASGVNPAYADSRAYGFSVRCLKD